MATTFTKNIDEFVGILDPKNLRKIWKDTINANRKLAEDITRLQLARGEKPDNSRMPKYKNPDYIQTKETPSFAPGKRVNLFNTGKFYKSIKVRATEREIIFASTDPKEKFLNARFGVNGDLLNWNDNSLEVVKDSQLLIDFRQRIQNELQT